MGHQTSHRMVAELLHDLGYSLQGNRKTLEGSSHPDRDAQFEHINARAQDYFATSDPVISVDTKKKELVGEFKNGGREWPPIWMRAGARRRRAGGLSARLQSFRGAAPRFHAGLRGTFSPLLEPSAC